MDDQSIGPQKVLLLSRLMWAFFIIYVFVCVGISVFMQQQLEEKPVPDSVMAYALGGVSVLILVTVQILKMKWFATKEEEFSFNPDTSVKGSRKRLTQFIILLAMSEFPAMTALVLAILGFPETIFFTLQLFALLSFASIFPKPHWFLEQS